MTLALLYPWLKALHVAAALVFVGGVMSVAAFLRACTEPHPIASAPDDRAVGQAADAAAMAATMRQWDRCMTTPAMLIVWAFGLGLAQRGAWLGDGWLQLKLLLVVLLSALHGVQSGRLRRLGQGGTVTPSRWSWLPFACLLGISVLAVVKPF